MRAALAPTDDGFFRQRQPWLEQARQRFDFGRAEPAEHLEARDEILGSQAEIEQSFRCLGNALRAPQFFDKWMKIEASRSTWTEYFRTLDGQTHRLRYRIHRGVLQEWVE